MSVGWQSSFRLAAGIVALSVTLLIGAEWSAAQPNPLTKAPAKSTAPAAPPPANRLQMPATDAAKIAAGRPGTLMQVPVSGLFPGAVNTRPRVTNPVAGDPAAAERGMRFFTSFNCVGCHAANGGGGIGPALSNLAFIYGSQPENIFLSIYQGRPNGMPAWGGVLPDSAIWDLVTYIGGISNAPDSDWGTTVSANPVVPKIQQVPAEKVTTTKPWSYTEPFTSGQKP